MFSSVKITRLSCDPESCSTDTLKHTLGNSILPVFHPDKALFLCLNSISPKGVGLLHKQVNKVHTTVLLRLQSKQKEQGTLKP